MSGRVWLEEGGGGVGLARGGDESGGGGEPGRVLEGGWRGGTAGDLGWLG